jgi:hypothetical protein
MRRANPVTFPPRLSFAAHVQLQPRHASCCLKPHATSITSFDLQQMQFVVSQHDPLTVKHLLSCQRWPTMAGSEPKSLPNRPSAQAGSSKRWHLAVPP